MPMYNVEFGYGYKGSEPVYRRTIVVTTPPHERMSETRALREARNFMRGDDQIDSSSIFIVDFEDY